MEPDPKTALSTATGGQILVDCLKRHQTDTVFCVPGESYLPVLDALYDARNSIQTITCRQEGGAANMADAYGKLTGKPGICFVTRGPGATNASIGVHTAAQDSTPMVLFVGQVARDQLGREAFQEVDYKAMFGAAVKWVAQVDDPSRLPEIISRAFHTATSGRAGPVVVSLPEDMLSQATSDIPDTNAYRPAQPAPAPTDMATLSQILNSAARPLVILGGSGWSETACANIARFIGANNLPTGTSFRCQDRLDNRHPNYVGDVGIGIDPALAKRVMDADVIVTVGARLGEITTSGYTLLKSPRPNQRLVHIHGSAEELNSVFQTELGICSSVEHFCAAVAAVTLNPSNNWADWASEARSEYKAYVNAAPACPGAVDLPTLYRDMRDILDDDAIITNGAGNYAAWSHRFFEFRTLGTQLAPTSGAMGYGVPAAIAAKATAQRAGQDRQVIALAGDGCFLMNGQELATAVHHKINVVIIVFNNGIFGTIRMHQERRYPERVHATQLTNPDFVAYAHAFGADSWRVEKTEQFRPALEQALACGKPALIEVMVDERAISHKATLADIRASAKAR